MTAPPELSTPAAPAAAQAALAPSRTTHLDDLAAKRKAAVADVLHPLVFDFSCFTRAMVQEASGYWGRFRMLDLGCGTGRVAMDLLSKMPCLDYVGLDGSEPMVWVFRKKAVRLSYPRQSVTFEAPVPVRQRDYLASVAPEGADMVVMSQFLQHVPLRSMDPGLYNRLEMLEAARDLTRDGGRIFIVEEVFGESAEEHLNFAVTWDKAISAKVEAHFARLEQVLGNIDPPFVDLLRTKRGHPALAAVMRERVERTGERQVMPVSAWYRMFDHLALRYRAIPHAALPNFYLFVIAR